MRKESSVTLVALTFIQRAAESPVNSCWAPSGLTAESFVVLTLHLTEQLEWTWKS